MIEEKKLAGPLSTAQWRVRVDSSLPFPIYVHPDVDSIRSEESQFAPTMTYADAQELARSSGGRAEYVPPRRLSVVAFTREFHDRFRPAGTGKARRYAPYVVGVVGGVLLDFALLWAYGKLPPL